jgi:hypothetical protein
MSYHRSEPVNPKHNTEKVLAKRENTTWNVNQYVERMAPLAYVGISSASTGAHRLAFRAIALT